MFEGQITLIKAYGHERARLRPSTESALPSRICPEVQRLKSERVPRAFVRNLEDELTRLAGFSDRDNKTVFIFDYADTRYAVRFHNLAATFISWGWHKMGDLTLPANLEIL